MPAFITIHRERIAWGLALITATALVVTMRSDRAGAGAGPIISTPVVYLATGSNFPDALAASSPAALGLGPVLLVTFDTVPTRTIDELNRLQPRQVIIVGGLGVISQGVEDTVDALAFNPVVTRIGGVDRYDTAADISEATFPTTGFYSRAGYFAADNLSDLSGGNTSTELEVLLTAPTNGILVINGGADTAYAASGLIVQCWIEVNDEEVVGSRRFIDLDATGTEQNCSTEGAVAVAPGSQTVQVRMSADGIVTVNAGAVSVIWVPFGPHGGTPVP